jgi:nicotinate-nucleotide adenylyltransferase
MVELACAGEPRFEASRLEAGTAMSYSIDTIGKVRASLSPDDELFFLIGADAFSEIESWRRWQDVVREVEFIVVSRPQRNYDIPPGARVCRLDDLEVPTSSSEIRRKIACGEFHVDLPPAVLAYIRERALYREGRAADQA